MSQPPTSDEDFMDGYYACDEAGFTALYERYSQQLARYFGQFVDEAAAEDLVQETFLRLARTKMPGRARFDRSRGTFRGWLYRIATNVLRTRWRDQGRSPDEGAGEGPPGTLEQLPAPDVGPPEWPAQQEEFSKAVQECLGSLTAARRQVLLLDLRGLSLQEIADALGIPYATAGTRLHHARRGMRSCLERRGYQFVPHGSPLSPGACVVMRFGDEVLISVERPQAG
jgi:RNA polymerase sigma-70 factor (ECF subfamily)